LKEIKKSYRIYTIKAGRGKKKDWNYNKYYFNNDYGGLLNGNVHLMILLEFLH
jgi:hypothetical protein